MLKRLFGPASIFALLACLALPLPAAATDYTDIWYLASESGWGANLIQGNGLIFITFFIYNSGGQPTFFVATMSEDANGDFSGDLYSTVGTYYGTPWNPAAWVPTLVGTASFFPIDPYDGTLTYVANGVTVTKTIQRQTLVPIPLGGDYVGGQSGTYSNCATASSYQDTFLPLTVTEAADGSVSFAFPYASGISCTLSGTLTPLGQLYSVANASYVCSDGTNTTANIDEIKATAYGIEGRWAASNVAGGCNEVAIFSGILYSTGSMSAAASSAGARTQTSRSPLPPRH